MTNLEKIAARSLPALTTQRISADGPGTIGRDLETLMDFIGERGLPTKSKQGNMPAAALPEINARLAAPIDVRLDRPLLQHYPNIAGLFVLLRVMELAHVERKRLWIDAGARASWRDFNPVEKYFALLEAWLFCADDVEFLGEQPRMARQFPDNLKFLLDLRTDRWTTFPEYYHLGFGDVSIWNTHLHHLFGLIQMEERPLAGRRSENRGWKLGKARRTPWGEAVAAVVANAAVEADQRAGGKAGGFCLHRPPEKAGFGFLQPAFGVHFPDWRRVFRAPRAAFCPGCHVFKVTMTDRRAGGKVWRRLAVPGQAMLDELADALLGAFEFSDTEHLYEFRFADQSGRGNVYYHPYTEEGPYASSKAVGGTDLSEKGVMKFKFDYGAGWRFELRLEKIEPPLPKKIRIVVRETFGKAPEQYPREE